VTHKEDKACISTVDRGLLQQIAGCCNSELGVPLEIFYQTSLFLLPLLLEKEESS
jgi:hypothetical protein